MRQDPHSYADLSQARTRDVALRWRVDFALRRIDGEAILTFVEPASGTVDLDTRGLDVEAVSDERGDAVAFELEEPDPILGARLRLELTAPTASVRITYRTGADASALMWLEAAQTAGTQPFVLSQCQAIHARSLAPLQDTPRARITYSAVVDVPDFATVVMSAAPGDAAPSEPGRTATHFAMPQPIPPYLLALAAGELVSRDLGPRCRVFAQPAVIDAAAWEFADAERMLEAAEELFGPYRWERYDFVVLPPSFPMGGMENPRMTFLTPTLLAGDRSLVGVLAHELAHSWTGNLVTNADNEHFWLNEGWTVWAERRILEHLYGLEEATQQSVLGRMALDEVMEARRAAGRSTALTYPQSGLDPDAEFSRIPYEKGFLLVTALERAAGRERFDRFVAAYIEAFSFQSLDSDAFIAFVRSELPEAAGVDLETWIEADGLPLDAPLFHSERLARLAGAARQGDAAAAGPDASTTEKLVVLARLPTSLDADEVARDLGISEASNAELRAAWLAYAVRSGATGLEPQLRAFLDRIGRTKLLRPVYAAMAERDDLAPLARAIYASNSARLHSSTRGTLEGLLGSAP